MPGATQPDPLKTGGSSFEDTMRRYSIIADFSQKEPERPVSPQVFWKYPFKAPTTEILPDLTLGLSTQELPVTLGEGRAIEHMNRGRTYFFAGDYDEARKSWLTGRSRFGTEYPFHRRNDYFIGLAFLQLAGKMRLQIGGNWQDAELRRVFANAATFLSWALIKKKDFKDPDLDFVIPKALLTLASIYYTYDRLSGAYAVAEEGLHFLLESGRKDYRFRFHKILAEALIRNHSYLRAVQELDTAIRQDPLPEDVGEAFGRIGDIYFDLNNYELAEDMYGLSVAINKITKKKDPVRTFLRAESLFWMGKFSDAQKAFWYALEELNTLPNPSPYIKPYATWGALRIADAYLARMQEAQDKKQASELAELTNESLLAYNRVIHEYRNTEASKIAKVRLDCLELPNFEIKNIDHSRLELANSKKSDLPAPLREIAWACEVSSYTQREKTPAMVARVKEFATTYPASQFSNAFVEPVRSMQASYLEDYLKEPDQHKAIAYFETNHATVFTKLSKQAAAGLFRAYVDTLQSKKAAPFYTAFKPENVEDTLRRLVFVSEIYESEKTPAWQHLGESLSQEFSSQNVRLIADEKTIAYVYRILRSPLIFANLAWIHRTAKQWAEKDSRFDCDMLYLTLSRSFDTRPQKTLKHFHEIQAIVDAKVPSLMKSDRKCALDYLELEQKAGEAFPKAYAEKWLKRTAWTLDKPIPEMFWLASETLADLDEEESAAKIWKFLSEKLPPESPEAKLSTIHLKPAIPETEKFWSQ